MGLSEKIKRKGQMYDIVTAVTNLTLAPQIEKEIGRIERIFFMIPTDHLHDSLSEARKIANGRVTYKDIKSAWGRLSEKIKKTLPEKAEQTSHGSNEFDVDKIKQEFALVHKSANLPVPEMPKKLMLIHKSIRNICLGEMSKTPDKPLFSGGIAAKVDGINADLYVRHTKQEFLTREKTACGHNSIVPHYIWKDNPLPVCLCCTIKRLEKLGRIKNGKQ